MTWDKVTPPASGISDEDNLASEGDLHKVYLTFDNVPSEHTSEILDVLQAYGVKATFFVNGNQDEEMLSVYQRIVDEGHTLGMNSYSNQYSVIYQSEDAFEQDYMTLRELIVFIIVFREEAAISSVTYRWITLFIILIHRELFIMTGMYRQEMAPRPHILLRK